MDGLEFRITFLLVCYALCFHIYLIDMRPVPLLVYTGIEHSNSVFAVHISLILRNVLENAYAALLRSVEINSYIETDDIYVFI